MKNELFKNKNIKGNNSTYSYGVEKTENDKSVEKKKIINDGMNISRKINNIFKSNSFVYKIDVIITVKGQKSKEQIIAKNNNYLLTIDNRKIYLNEIEDIVEI